MRISDWSSDVCSSDLAGNGDDQHAGRLDRFWFAEPVDRFDQDINRNREQHEGVERGCQDLEALVAKGALIVGWPRPDQIGPQPDGQRGALGQYVSSVGKEREDEKDKERDNSNRQARSG